MSKPTVSAVEMKLDQYKLEFPLSPEQQRLANLCVSEILSVLKGDGDIGNSDKRNRRTEHMRSLEKHGVQPSEVWNAFGTTGLASTTLLREVAARTQKVDFAKVVDAVNASRDKRMAERQPGVPPPPSYVSDNAENAFPHLLQTPTAKTTKRERLPTPQAGQKRRRIAPDPDAVPSRIADTSIVDLTGRAQDGTNLVDDIIQRAIDSLDGEQWLTTEAIHRSISGLNATPNIFEVVEPTAVRSKASYDPCGRTKLIVALNINDNHWTLAIVDVNSHTVKIYDPLSNDDYYRASQMSLASFLTSLPAIDEPGTWQYTLDQCDLRQSDSSNCGIYIIVRAVCEMADLSTPSVIRPEIWRHVCQAYISREPQIINLLAIQISSASTENPTQGISEIHGLVEDCKAQWSPHLAQYHELELLQRLVDNALTNTRDARKHIERLTRELRNEMRLWGHPHHALRPTTEPSGKETALGVVGGLLTTAMDIFWRHMQDFQRLQNDKMNTALRKRLEPYVPPTCPICPGPCDFDRYVHGTPSAAVSQDIIFRGLHKARDLVNHNEHPKPLARSWLQNITMAKEADISSLSEEEFVHMVENGSGLNRAIVVRQVEQGTVDITTWASDIADKLGTREIDFSGPDGSRRTLNASGFKMLMEQPKHGYNALKLPEASSAQPLFMQSRRLQFLKTLLWRLPGHKDNDITEMLSFGICGCPGAFSGAHVDALTGTWVRNLFGIKLWMFVGPDKMDDRDWKEMSERVQVGFHVQVKPAVSF